MRVPVYEDSSLVFPATPQLNTGGCPYRGIAYRPGYMKSLNPSVECVPKCIKNNYRGKRLPGHLGALVLDHRYCKHFCAVTLVQKPPGASPCQTQLMACKRCGAQGWRESMTAPMLHAARVVDL